MGQSVLPATNDTAYVVNFCHLSVTTPCRRASKVLDDLKDSLFRPEGETNDVAEERLAKRVAAATRLGGVGVGDVKARTLQTVGEVQRRTGEQ